METLVVGAGPAGIMASLESAKNGNETILIEQNNEIGKKLKITGKGRCNITSSLPIDDFYKNIFNSKFLYSVFSQYDNIDIIKYLNENNIDTKIERGNRVFPKSDNAKQIVDFFYSQIRKNNIDLRLNTKVTDLIIKDNICKGVVLENGQKILASRVIIATGGASYKQTGSDGKMLEVLKEKGIDIKNFAPSLCGIEVKEQKQCQNCMGLSLKNVKLSVYVKSKKEKCIFQEQGEMLFTHFGVSRPLVLTASAYLSHLKDIDQLLNEKVVKFYIDLKPALSFETLDKRVLRDFEKYSNKELKNGLVDLLPKNIIDFVIINSKIDKTKKINEITKDQRQNLVKTIKSLELTPISLRPIDEAIISNGGVLTKALDPKTMESKQIQNLYFAGEIIDLDGLTGGFNLQIAYSTGVIAGGTKSN